MTGQLETRNIRGLETAWWRAGNPKGPLLLFLHGYPDSPETWEYQVPHLTDRFDIVCPYTRGAGPSEKSKKLNRYGLDAAALDLLQIIGCVDPSGTRDIYCIGHDLGAVHASNLAPYLPGRLKGLVLINGLPLQQMAGRLSSLRQHMKSWYIYFMQIPVLPETAIGMFPGLFLRFAHNVGEVPTPRALKKKQVEGCLTHPINQYRAFARELPRLRRKKFPRLECPLLVIWGNRDSFLVAPSHEELVPFAARFTTRILEGNHWIHREQSKHVNRLLDEFFKGAESGIANAS